MLFISYDEMYEQDQGHYPYYQGLVHYSVMKALFAIDAGIMALLFILVFLILSSAFAGTEPYLALVEWVPYTIRTKVTVSLVAAIFLAIDLIQSLHRDKFNWKMLLPLIIFALIAIPLICTNIGGVS